MECLSITPERLRVEVVGNGRSARLLDDIQGKFEIIETEHALVVIAPAGMVTDWASVPRLFWRILPQMGEHNKAAILHDYLYRYQPAWWTRKMSDQAFLAAMEYLGVPWWKRRAMYTGVRIGGWWPWRKNRRK